MSQSGHAIGCCDVQIGISAAADAIFSGFAQWSDRKEGGGIEGYLWMADNGNGRGCAAVAYHLPHRWTD